MPTVMLMRRGVRCGGCRVTWVGVRIRGWLWFTVHSNMRGMLLRNIFNIRKPISCSCSLAPPLIKISSQFIMKMRFQRIISIRNLVKPLNPLPLTNKHVLHFIYALTTLTSSMSYESTFSAKFMHSLISALNPSLSTIIQTKHKSRDYKHSWIQSHFHPHKSYIPKQPIFPINFLKRSSHMAHSFS